MATRWLANRTILPSRQQHEWQDTYPSEHDVTLPQGRLRLRAGPGPTVACELHAPAAASPTAVAVLERERRAASDVEVRATGAEPWYATPEAARSAVLVEVIPRDPVICDVNVYPPPAGGRAPEGGRVTLRWSGRFGADPTLSVPHDFAHGAGDAGRYSLFGLGLPIAIALDVATAPAQVFYLYVAR